MAVLGPKSSACLTILSIWAIIMLSIMGGLLRIHSVAFAEDFEAEDIDEVYHKYDNAVSYCNRLSCILNYRLSI